VIETVRVERRRVGDGELGAIGRDVEPNGALNGSPDANTVGVPIAVALR